MLNKGLWDWSQTVAAPTELLKKLEDPLQIAIVQNYRRHFLMEMCGRWKEVVAPDMCVEEPVYNFAFPGITGHLIGQQVHDMYNGTLIKVFPENEKMAVSDWGIASQSTVHQYVPGSLLAEAGMDVESPSPDKYYLMSCLVHMFWHYTDKGLLIGEDVAAQMWTVNIEPVPDGEPTMEEIDEELNRLIALYEPEWRASLLT